MDVDFVFMLLTRSADGSLTLLGAIPNIQFGECLRLAMETNQLPHEKFGVCMPVIR